MAKPPSGGKRRARARLFCVRARRGEGGRRVPFSCGLRRALRAAEKSEKNCEKTAFVCQLWANARLFKKNSLTGGGKSIKLIL